VNWKWRFEIAQNTLKKFISFKILKHNICSKFFIVQQKIVDECWVNQKLDLGLGSFMCTKGFGFWWLYTHKGQTLTNVCQNLQELGVQQWTHWCLMHQAWVMKLMYTISKHTHNNIDEIWCSWIDLTSCTHNIAYTQ